MGRFIYHGEQKVDFPDRLLQHLQYVMSAKLRRGEKFLFSWAGDASVGHGRTTVWISAGSALTFRYSDHRHAPLNRSWLQELMHAADSPSGLYPIEEPTDTAAMTRRPADPSGATPTREVATDDA